jgi:4-hydroxy-tetrahydrodipicolinate reductase
MNIALIGYGKMGVMVESVARERGHTVVAKVDPFAFAGGSKDPILYADIASAAKLADADVAVEFTRPDTALGNIKALSQRKLPTVVGTTGWHASLPAVEALVRESGSALLWSSNFSLGVNLFYRIAAYAARLADPFAEYDVGGWEAHHNKKADSPSGTAKTLVERVLAEMTRKKTAQWETLDRPPAPEELHYPSLRLGSIPGTHTLFFDSPADTIEITHTARSREGFARGAVRAAEWLVCCPGPGAPGVPSRKGVFTMDDALAEILGKS